MPLAAREPPHPLHIDFLWQQPQEGVGIHAEALGLLQETDAPRQLCCRKWRIPLTDPLDVVVSAEGAHGNLVLQDAHGFKRASTSVHCRALSLAILVDVMGIWRSTVAIGALAGGSATIEGARALVEPGFAVDPMRPYVRSRPIYAPAVAGCSGELQLVIGVAVDGSIREV